MGVPECAERARRRERTLISERARREERTIAEERVKLSERIIDEERAHQTVGTIPRGARQVA